MNNEDYLGITALALSRVVESLTDSTDPKRINSVLSLLMMAATESWLKEQESSKELFLTSVKSLINHSVNTMQGNELIRDSLKN